jgi:hypothetical protein
MKNINPFSLLDGYLYSFVESDTEKEMAYCVVEKNMPDEKEKKTYSIYMNKSMARKFYSLSWSSIEKKFSFDAFYGGLLIHEISHIVTGSFTATLPLHNGVIDHIHNTLLDSQSEYGISVMYPGVLPFLRVTLTTLDYYLNLNAPTPKLKELEKKMKTLFHFVRFGVVLPESDEEFVQFLFPLLLSSKRGTAQNVVACTTLIYEYLTKDMSLIEKEQIQKSLTSVGVITADAKEFLEKADQALPSPLFDAIKNGKIAGIGKTIVSTQNAGSDFYQRTIKKHAKLIRILRELFQKRLDKYQYVPSAEGDLNLQKQQEAYAASFVNEYPLVYGYQRKKRTTLDVAIGRDCSGSIWENKQEFAELTIVLMAALAKLDGIRSAQIDFDDSAETNLEFDQPIDENTIEPNAGGGTFLTPLYREAQKMKWRAQKRVLLIITDGDESDEQEASQKERELQKEGVFVSKWFLGQSKNEDVRSTSFQTFHLDIVTFLLELL